MSFYRVYGARNYRATTNSSQCNTQRDKTCIGRLRMIEGLRFLRS